VALLGLKLGAAYIPSAQDTGALAASIQLSGARFDEIVDVGGTPRYALSLYLGVNVERVHLDPSGSLKGSSTVEFLGRELESDRSSERLFIVRARDMDSFTRICESHGFTVGVKGEQGRYRFVQLRRGPLSRALVSAGRPLSPGH
jgi:hypothetical protein